MLYWISLIIAGLCEIIGVFVMKKFVLSNDKKFLALLVAVFACSFLFLSYSMREIPMSVSYAIWTGIGAGGGVLVGILFFKESKSLLKIIFLILIILSSIGLKAIE